MIRYTLSSSLSEGRLGVGSGCGRQLDERARPRLARPQTALVVGDHPAVRTIAELEHVRGVGPLGVVDHGHQRAEGAWAIAVVVQRDQPAIGGPREPRER